MDHFTISAAPCEFCQQLIAARDGAAAAAAYFQRFCQPWPAPPPSHTPCAAHSDSYMQQYRLWRRQRLLVPSEVRA